MVKHFLLDCPFYRKERHVLQSKLRRNTQSLSFLFSSPIAIKPSLKYVHSTGCFKSFLEARNHSQCTNAKNVADLRAGAHAFKQWIADPNTIVQLQQNHSARQAPDL